MKRLLILSIFLACGGSPEEKARAVLEAGLEDESEKVQIAAAGALARIGESRGEEVLSEFLKSGDNELVAITIDNLSRIPDTINSRYLRPMLKHRSPLVRRMAIEGLLKLGVRDDRIIDCLKESSVPIVVCASRYCGMMKVRKAKPALRRLLRRKEPEVRINAEIGLALLGERGAIARLKKEMERKEPVIWEEAIKGLGLVKDTASIEFLEEVIEGGIWPLNILSIESLMRIGIHKDKILERFLSSDDPMVRIRAISIINELGDDRFLGSVLGLTEDPFLNVAIQAIEFCSRHPTPEVREKLASLLNAKNPYIRIAAAEGYLRSKTQR